MDAILNFLADYRLVFAVISLVLLFALVGLVANNKRKKVVKEDVDSQPIVMDKNIVENHVVKFPDSEPTLIIEDKQQKPPQPVFEPSLDGFATNVTEVKVSGMENLSEESMLIIEDKSINDSQTQLIKDNDTPALVIEDKIINDGPTLVIEDKSINDGPTLVIEEKHEETPMLVLDENAKSLGTEIKEESMVQDSVKQNDEIQETLDL